MAWIPETPHLGLPPITSTIAVANTTQPKPWKYGDIVRFVDPVYGVGEFIYLKGVASTVVGSLVTYDLNAGTTTLAPATGGNGPVAVAMSANLLNFAGWYQITGIAAVKAPNAMVVGADIFMLAATPGSVDDAAVNGEQILNAKALSTTGNPSAGLALIEINRPFLQGQIV